MNSSLCPERMRSIKSPSGAWAGLSLAGTSIFQKPDKPLLQFSQPPSPPAETQKLSLMIAPTSPNRRESSCESDSRPCKEFQPAGDKERRQKRRITPPLATTLCWVLEFNLTFRPGLPERKS